MRIDFLGGLSDGKTRFPRKRFPHLSGVVDPDATLRVAHGNLLPPGRPADPVEGRRPLHGDTGGGHL